MRPCQSSSWLTVLVLAFSCAAHPQEKADPPSKGVPRAQRKPAHQITVGPNARVSTFYANNPHYEVLLAAHPNDRGLLLACTGMVSRGRELFWDTYTRTIVYGSRDCGKTWKPFLDYGPTEGRIDPTCEYGLDEDVYFAELVNEFGKDLDQWNPRVSMRVHHSQDGGQTWRAPVTIPYFIDRPYISVDRTQGRNRGRVYIHGTANMPRLNGSPGIPHLRILYSDDKAKSFQDRLIGAAPGDDHIGMPGNGVVLSDGTLIIPFTVNLKQREERWGGERTWLRVVRSTNGGESFEPSSTVAEFYRPVFGEGTEALSAPYLAVDPGSEDFKDRLYLVWTDKRLGRLRIMISYSSDKGKSWLPPKVIDEDGWLPNNDRAPDNFLPVAAVNRYGVVAVAWYDRRDHPDNLGWSLRFRASLDGGETFLPSVRVSEVPNAYNEGTEWDIRAHARRSDRLSFLFMLNGFFFIAGHTSGMTVDAAGTFHPLWVDNRTGVAQLWTAPVAVNGTAARNGSQALRSFIDVSSQIGVAFSDVRYDRTRNLLRASLRLKNTSSETIEGPLVLRALGFLPPSYPSGLSLGIPEIVNADSELEGSGVEGRVWDFTNLLLGNKLRPGEMSQKKELVFQLSDVQPFRDGPSRVNRVLASFDARVLARASVPSH